MFKGLRTKIESEQKGQASTTSSLLTQTKPSINNINNNTANRRTDSPQSGAQSYTLSEDNSKSTSDRANQNGSGLSEKASERDVAQPARDYSANSSQHQTYQQSPLGNQSVDQLRVEVTRLQEQLKSVIKDRDDSNDQNGQLYQLIEKLRRNLESEKEANLNIRAKLEEAEKKISETNQNKNEPDKRGAKQTSSAKSFDPSLMLMDTGDLTGALQSDDIEGLRKHLIDLQGQITDKNRQLKIRQQNLNDMKRHLQMEIAEHAKTQEELNKVQNQLKHANQISSAVSSESATPQNGSSSCDIDSNKSGSGLNNNNTVVGSTTGEITRQSSVHNDGFHEMTRAPDSIAGHIQFDNISCISRSSNSVDENDLHDHSSIREINNEYLKNVLYRYMTSTDTETAKHLVKALSVMMNFTPEQTAAIKSAMNARSSSWLRLK